MRISRRQLLKGMSVSPAGLLVFASGTMDRDGTKWWGSPVDGLYSGVVFLYGRVSIDVKATQRATREQMEKWLDEECRGLKTDFLNGVFDRLEGRKEMWPTLTPDPPGVDSAWYRSTHVPDPHFYHAGEGERFRV